MLTWHMSKLIRFSGLGLLTGGVALAGALAWFVRRPWPETRGTLKLAGLSAPVEIIRDRWGVPHIYAQTQHDLVMAQGYVHAQDRLWQMEFNRRLACGTLSEILGKATLDADRFLRTIGLRRSAERDQALLEDEMHVFLQIYTDGINAYINSHRSRLPLEFTILRVHPETWTPLDALACGKIISFSLGANREFELLYSRFLVELGAELTKQLLPPHPSDAPVILPPEVYTYTPPGHTHATQPSSLVRVLGEPNPEWGSNSWVAHGNRTESGMPLLANDTHLGLALPCVWYTNGLHGGDFDCVGFSLPGVPLVFIGHNRAIAWGVSNLGPDVQDLYLEKLDDPVQPTSYQFRGQWRNLETISEVIAVKGKESEQLKILATCHGPLINSVMPGLERAEPMALRWTGLEGSCLFRSIVRLNLAQNWEEFRNALRDWDVPSQNFVYADVTGNIGYQATGKIPIRAPGHQGIVPVPGWDGNYEWQGFIPFEELPAAFNPAPGLIVTANNRVVPDDYPYHLAYEWAPPYRAQRIMDLLSAQERLTLDDMRAIQADTYGQPAMTLRPYLLDVMPENVLQERALNYVKSWDLRYEPNRIGASIYQIWYWFLVQHVFVEPLGSELMQDFMAYPFLHVPHMEKWLARIDNRDEVVRRSFVDAINWLCKKYGTNPRKWQWGRLHTITFIHQPLGQSGIRPLELLFNSKGVPAAGDYSTVNAGTFNFKKPFAMISGPAQRVIIDLNDFNCSLAVHTTGQSGHLFHPHREDFVALWQKTEYHPLLYERECVEIHAEARLILNPA